MSGFPARYRRRDACRCRFELYKSFRASAEMPRQPLAQRLLDDEAPCRAEDDAAIPLELAVTGDFAADISPLPHSHASGICLRRVDDLPASRLP